MLLLVVANFRWKVFGWNLPISTAETGEITITYGVYDFAGNPAVSVKRCVDSFRVIARVVTTVVLVEGQMMIYHCVHVKGTKLESSIMFIFDFFVCSYKYEYFPLANSRTVVVYDPCLVKGEVMCIETQTCSVQNSCKR